MWTAFAQNLIALRPIAATGVFRFVGNVAFCRAAMHSVEFSEFATLYALTNMNREYTYTYKVSRRK